MPILLLLGGLGEGGDRIGRGLSCLELGQPDFEGFSLVGMFSGGFFRYKIPISFFSDFFNIFKSMPSFDFAIATLGLPGVFLYLLHTSH